jgi:hypothetical protein
VLWKFFEDRGLEEIKRQKGIAEYVLILVRFQTRLLDFSVGIILPAALRPWNRLSL